MEKPSTISTHIALAIFLPTLLTLLVLMGAVGYLLGQQKKKEAPQTLGISITPTTQPTIAPTPATKQFENSQLSFIYPSDWNTIPDIPKEFRYNIIDYQNANSKSDIVDSFGKMFAVTCRGPILFNEKMMSIIAFEIIDPPNDNRFCWSGGQLFEPEKRWIVTLSPKHEITINKWKMNDFIYPIKSNNTKDDIVKVSWSGDWLEQFTMQKPQKRYLVVVALYSQDASRRLAEKVYDEVLGSIQIK